MRAAASTHALENAMVQSATYRLIVQGAKKRSEAED